MPADPLTDDQARDLLAAAAATIDVDPADVPVPSDAARWPRTLALTGAAALVASIALAAVLFGTWGGQTPPPVVTPTPSPTTDAEPVEVPWVLKLRTSEAEEALTVAGFRATVRGRPDCAQPIVRAQDPEGGTVAPAGSAIALRLACPPGASTGLDLNRVAQRFVGFAKGGPAVPPMDTPVGLYLGGRKVATMETARIGQRQSWTVCPPSGAYAGRDCPISALDVLRDADDLNITPSPSAPSCATWSVPSELTQYHRTSITIGDSCADWAAVTLYLNDVSQVVAVDLTMAEP